jgi:hypothetical protein
VCQEDAETLLLHRERRVYLSALADALAGADLARDALTKAVRQLARRCQLAPPLSEPDPGEAPAAVPRPAGGAASLP